MLSFKTMELIRNSGHVSSQFVDLVLGDFNLMRMAAVGHNIDVSGVD